MSTAIPCSICQEGGHRSSKCPELVKDLQPGFYRGTGGMPQGGGEEDERLTLLLTPIDSSFPTVKRRVALNYRA